MDLNDTTLAKQPTHVWYLDLLTEGGIREGEMISVVTPSGGGKTLCAMQLVHEQVNKNIHIAHISTKQGLEGDLVLLQMSLLSGEPHDVFREKFQHWPEEDKQDIYAKLMKQNKYHHFFDCTQTKFTKITELLWPMETLIRKGTKPMYMIIDEWLCIEDSMMEFEAKKQNYLSDADKQNLRSYWLNEIRKWAKRTGIIPIIFQQASGNACAQAGGSIIERGNASENKQFENHFDFNLTFGSKDGGSNIMINPTTNYEQSSSKAIRAHLNGAYCKIDPLNTNNYTAVPVADKLTEFKDHSLLDKHILDMYKIFIIHYEWKITYRSFPTHPGDTFSVKFHQKLCKVARKINAEIWLDVLEMHPTKLSAYKDKHGFDKWFIDMKEKYHFSAFNNWINEVCGSKDKKA